MAAGVGVGVAGAGVGGGVEATAREVKVGHDLVMSEGPGDWGNFRKLPPGAYWTRDKFSVLPSGEACLEPIEGVLGVWVRRVDEDGGDAAGYLRNDDGLVKGIEGASAFGVD